MAIQVLIDHTVEQENIVLICSLLTEIGIRRILNVFPQITIVVGQVSRMDIAESGLGLSLAVEDLDDEIAVSHRSKVERTEEEHYNSNSLKLLGSVPMEGVKSRRFADTDWPFRTRFIDSLYFGTD